MEASDAGGCLEDEIHVTEAYRACVNALFPGCYIRFHSRFRCPYDELGVGRRWLSLIHPAAIRGVKWHIGWNGWPAKAIERRTEVATVSVRIVEISTITILMIVWISLWLRFWRTVLWTLIEQEAKWTAEWSAGSARASSAWLCELGCSGCKLAIQCVHHADVNAAAQCHPHSDKNQEEDRYI